MQLKRYKPLILQFGILLFISAIFVFFLERQSKFISIDFSKQYEKNKTIELSGFEEGETWSGNFSYDSLRVLEGKSSITFSSWYGASNTITKEAVIKIPPGYTKGYVSIFISDIKNVTSIKSFDLGLSGATNKEKRYDFTPLLHVGWNRVPFIVPEWGSTSILSFTLLSHSGAIAEVNLDRVWLENTSFYTADVLSTKSQALSLRTIGNRTYLYSSSAQLQLYSFTSPSTMQKGSVTLSLIPEHGKTIQLDLNGTTVKISGNNMNECSLFRATEKPLVKVLQKTSAKDDLYVFLKAQISGKNVSYSISNNGVDYEDCGTIVKAQNSPPQLSLQGSYLLDSYSVEY